MERMKVKYVINGKDYVTLPAYEILEEKYNQLEEENKNLKSDLAGTQKIGESWRQECKQLREDVDYFRQCYLDLKKLCEKEGFMLSDEEVTKMFNLDEIK